MRSENWRTLKFIGYGLMVLVFCVMVAMEPREHPQSVSAQAIVTATPFPTETPIPLPTRQPTPVIYTPKLLFTLPGVWVYSFYNGETGEVGTIAVTDKDHCAALSTEPVQNTHLFQGGFAAEGQ
jgi:hypothetical protein